MSFTHLGAVEPRGHVPSSFFCSITRTCGRRQEKKEGSICFHYFRHTKRLKFYSVSKCYWLALSKFIFPTSQRSPIWSHTNPFSVIRSKILPNGIRGATPVVNPCDKASAESSYYILYVPALESICGSRVEYWCVCSWLCRRRHTRTLEKVKDIVDKVSLNM